MADTKDKSHSLKAGLGQRRTNFADDLLLFDSILCEICDCSTLTGCTWAREYYDEQSRVQVLQQMFEIVLYRYDIRERTDFEDMKGMAGLGLEHFKEMKETLDDKFREEEPDQFDLMQLQQLHGLMTVIQAIRDEGMPPPKFGLGETAVLRDKKEIINRFNRYENIEDDRPQLRMNGIQGPP